MKLQPINMPQYSKEPLKNLVDDEDRCRKKTCRAFEFLESKNLIFAGSNVSGNIVEEALGIHLKDEKFENAYLELFACIEDRCFFVIADPLNLPGFRILPTEEMAEHALKNMKKATAKVAKTADIMSSHDHSKLDETQQKIWHFQERKAAEISLFNQKILYKRNFV